MERHPVQINEFHSQADLCHSQIRGAIFHHIDIPITIVTRRLFF